MTYLAVALAAMMVFLQSDVLYLAFPSNQVALGHLDVYDYFSRTPSLRVLDTVNPPLFYLLMGGYLKLLLLLHVDPVPHAASQMYSTVFGQRHGLVFATGIALLKIPYLVVAVVGLWLCLKLARRQNLDPLTVAVLWLASPVMIVTSLMQSQNDVFPATATVGALLALERRSPMPAMVLLGLAGCFKLYPLLLIPVVALFICRRNILTTIRLCALGAVIPVVVAAPFLDSAFIHRVLGAHDGDTLLATSNLGRMPLEIWPLAYASILVLAWILSDRDHDLSDICRICLLTLGTIFVLGWWVPQWTVWLLPMAIVLAPRDRLFSWLWLAMNALMLANNLANFPGNMDGGMLVTIFGQGPRPVLIHNYLWHLFRIDKNFPFELRDGVYTVCTASFVALSGRAAQGLFTAPDLDPRPPQTMWKRAGEGWLAAAAPFLLLPYVLVMVIQRLLGTVSI